MRHKFGGLPNAIDSNHELTSDGPLAVALHAEGEVAPGHNDRSCQERWIGTALRLGELRSDQQRDNPQAYPNDASGHIRLLPSSKVCLGVNDLATRIQASDSLLREGYIRAQQESCVLRG
jgi:hypothetical protein